MVAWRTLQNQAHIAKSSKTMFSEAVQPILSSIAPLRTAMQGLVASVCVDKTVKELRENYGIFWEHATPSQLAARLSMR